jgi:hypothetical protein
MTGLTGTATAAEPDPTPGDETMVIAVGDDVAGGTYDITFEKAYAGATPDGTPVYIYAPKGYQNPDGVLGLDPDVDPDGTDKFKPCGGDVADNTMPQDEIDALGDELANHVVAVDESHFGPIGDANGPEEQGGDALVALFYNVFDEAYYDCGETSYTAGYYAPPFKDEYGMNVIVLDTNDFSEMTGDPEHATDLTNEGVIAHELQHLVHDYSDANELSWVNEGLADFAMFLNGYPTGGSHITYHQVFHRETSLTRWAGGLENYGAAYTFFQYLWEQAGGNGTKAGDAQFEPDSEYDGVAGDLLIKTIFEEQANGMEGVQNAIDTYNTLNIGAGNDLPSVEELFKQWSVAVYLDDESSDLYDIKAIDIGGVDSQGWTIDIANDEFFKNRGSYNGATPEGRFAHDPHVPAQSALPFGTSYETFRNPGKTFRLDFDGPATTQVVPGDEKFWFGGTESQSDHILDVDAPVTAGDVLTFDTWYFIEQGWDYGYVEAEVDGEWVTVPVTSDGQVITTDTNPQGNNDEGNGLTGTSGGEYFVDEPALIPASVTLPEGTTDVRFRYSTDAAYVDTGWFVNDVQLNGTPAVVTSPEDEWVFTDPVQENNWSVQIISPCDLTPGKDIDGESQDAGRYIYELQGSDISQSFSRCSTKESFTVVISNLTSGAINTLDAPYKFRITNTAAKGQKK